jgi:hypothetical protein
VSATFMEEKGNFISDTLKVSSGSPSQATILNYLERYDGTTQQYVLQTFPSVIGNFGFADFGIGAGNLDVQRYKLQFVSTGNLPNDSVNLSEDRAQIALGSAALKLGGGKVLLGVTAKTVRYSELTSSQTYAQIEASGKLDLTGSTVTYGEVPAYDAGILYRMEWLSSLRSQWSLTAYNIGGYTLSGLNNGVKQIVYVPDTYNFGFALQPEAGPIHMVLSLEVEDLLASIKVQDANGVNQPRADEQRLHAGIEIGVFKTPTGNNWLNVRAGSNRGYLTYGAEVNFGGWTRLVYVNGTDDNGYRGHPAIFQFEAYQIAIGGAF